MDLMGRALYLFTDLPRDDGSKMSAVYDFPLLKENAEAAAEVLIGLGIKSKK